MATQLMSVSRAVLPAVPRPQGPPSVDVRGPVVRQVTCRVRGDDVLSREGLSGLLRRCPEVEVVADSAGPGVDVAVVVADRVDTWTVRGVREARSSARRVVLVVSDVDAASASDALAAGAVGIVRRAELTRTSLGQLVRAVAAGEAILPADLLTALLVRPAATGTTPADVEPATDRPSRRLSVVGLDERETEVLRLLSEGSDTREIAQRLSYSERTVKAVIQDITHRFGLRNRSHAVAYALRHGLI